MIYEPALHLSALAVLVAVILGNEIAGILGALAAIPIAGSIQVSLTGVLGRASMTNRAVARPRRLTTGFTAQHINGLRGHGWVSAGQHHFDLIWRCIDYGDGPRNG